MEIIIPLVKPFHGASVEADAVEVLVVGVFILFAPHGRKIDHTARLVYFQDVVDVPRTVGQLAFEVAFVVVEIEMGPAVALAPLHEFLAVGDGRKRTHLLIRVHPLLDDGDDGILPDGVGADVDSM